jgi:hypothetical protein
MVEHESDEEKKRFSLSEYFFNFRINFSVSRNAVSFASDRITRRLPSSR